MKKNAKLLITAGALLIGFSQLSPVGLSADALSIPTKDAKPTTTGNRSIFMNGVDISSARNQDLRNVHVRIDEYGNMFITAPQYQVTEEETFTPLSSYSKAPNTPEHKPMQAAPTVMSSGEVAKDSALAAPVPVPQNDTPGPVATAPQKPAAAKPPRS